MHYSINHILENAKNIPDYFGVSVELAGREVARHNVQLWSETYTMGRKGGTTKKTFVTTSPDLPLSAANDAYGSKTNRWLPVESAIFATATGTESAGQFLKVNIHLSSPTALYKLQRTRSIWFGGLILVSALAAFAGLASAYRSFQQQVRLSEMKSNFVSSVSHELRAPVASMRLMAEALDRGKIVAAEKQKEYYGFIVQECRRLSSMVENVLDFSRIDQGRKEYQFEPTDLQTLVEQTVKLMEPYAAERQVTLALANPSLSTLHSSLSLDGMALQQALINLVDNAIKHSPAQATVNVGLESDEASVRLWVEDCGAGIPAEEQEKIFERFYRRGSELRRETQGIGIGLTIVKHIVAAHGGRVIVQSGVGQGSRFTMELPVNDNLRKEI